MKNSLAALAHIRYCFPALSHEEQELEAYLQSLEESEPELLDSTYDVECMPATPFGVEADSACNDDDESPRKEKCRSFFRKMNLKGAGAVSPRPQYEYAVECDFDAERERIQQEIRERIAKLRELGVDELVLRKLFEKEDTLSRLVITRDFRIVLPDYHNMEIEMTPLPKAVFLLYLRHEEGISFKFLADYEDELRDIYIRLTDRIQSDVIDKSIRDICDPTLNAINEKCSRIREAFLDKFDERLARHYFVTGKRGEVKRIQLPRPLVTWE